MHVPITSLGSTKSYLNRMHAQLTCFVWYIYLAWFEVHILFLEKFSDTSHFVMTLNFEFKQILTFSWYSFPIYQLNILSRLLEPCWNLLSYMCSVKKTITINVYALGFFPGNVTTVLVVIRNSYIRNQTYIYLTNLAITDILTLLVGKATSTAFIACGWRPQIMGRVLS